MLGYLNFSQGKPDPRFQKNVNEFFRHSKAELPGKDLHRSLCDALAAHEDSPDVFRNTDQAQAVLNLVFDSILPAYREFHRDLLGHWDEQHLYSPFFLIRVLEAVLAQGGSWRGIGR